MTYGYGPASSDPYHSLVYLLIQKSRGYVYGILQYKAKY